MDARTVNRISGTVPVLLSLLAFGVAMTTVGTGWERGRADEGAAAHIFQLLIAAEAPIVLVFLASADWNRVGYVAGNIALQAIALAIAFAPVAVFKL